MNLKMTNKGLKCPNCKKFGLKPLHIERRENNYSLGTHVYIEEEYGHDKHSLRNFFRCQNCYAEFEEELYV